MPQSVPRYLRTIVQDLMTSGRLPFKNRNFQLLPVVKLVILDLLLLKKEFQMQDN